METVTKKNLIQKISQKLNLHPKEVGEVIQNFLDNVTEALSKGDRLEFRDFGVFEVVQRKKKIGRNPKNASVPITIPARKAVKFTAGKFMKKEVEKQGSTPLQNPPQSTPPPQNFNSTPNTGM